MSSYLPDDELRAFIATLPTRRLASAAVMRREDGAVLLVEPNYKPGWILPGGTTEPGEDPRTGCFREVQEELGLTVPAGRLLMVSHGIGHGMWGDSVHFLYDGGVLPDDPGIRLQEEELLSWAWVAPADLDEHLGAGGGAYIRLALEHLRKGTTGEVVN